MGVIGGVVGSAFGRIAGAGGAQAVGSAVQGVAEVFTPNATRRMELSHEAFTAALAAAGAEFEHVRDGWFDRFVNGLNRLPRPMLALGTLGLFVYAMAEPAGFATRMQGLGHVPEPLWWLLGAVVSFYFGAREAHHFRLRRPTAPVHVGGSDPVAAAGDVRAVADNPALADWRAATDG